MKLTIKDNTGKDAGELEVKFPIVEDGRGTQAVHDTVVAYQAAQRMGYRVVTLAETRDLRAAHRVGWGVVIGRALAAVVKVFAGMVILVIGGFALLA